VIAARFFDGRSSRAHPVHISVDAEGLRIVGDAIDRIVARDRLAFTRGEGGAPSRIALDDGAACEIDGTADIDALFDELGHRPGVAERLGARMSRVIVLAIAFVAICGAFYVWGIPLVADFAVDHAPRRWDDALGEQVLKTLDDRKIFRPTRLSDERRDRILARFAQVRLPAEGVGVTIVFRRLGVPNALALPDGTIVVSDELVELADGDDDALATVLAHEVGHVAHRDAMRALTRNTLATLLATWYFGDVSNGAALLAGNLGGLRFSREAEHAADLYALRAMQASGISTHGAAELFRRLDGWRPPKKKSDEKNVEDKSKASDDRVREAVIPEYLSTHPATEGRIRLFETGNESADPR